MIDAEAYQLALGKVVWSFADLYYHFKRILVMAKILSVEESMKATKHLSMSELIKMTNNRLKNKFKDNKILLKEWDKVYEEAKKVTQERNDILHSEWLSNSTFKYLRKYNEKKNKIEEFTPEDITKVSTNIHRTDIRVVKFVRKYFEPMFR